MHHLWCFYTGIRVMQKKLVILLTSIDNICDQIRLLELEHQGSEISDHVTISCGSASMVPDDSFTPKALINRADKALYQAKEAGRNCAYHNYV